MRAEFRQYYAPSPEEFEQLWSDGVIVLDTNVLFNLYRYSLPTRQTLMATIEHFADRLWVPYRVALEYQRRRVVEMSTHRAVYEKLRSSVETFEVEMEKKLKQHSRHPILDVETTLGVIRSATQAIKDHIEEIEKTHPDLPAGSAPGSDDPIRDLLTKVFEGRVGAGFSLEDLDLIYLQGVERYEEKIPPGYADLDNKKGDEVYGDLIIWKEVIRMAKDVDRPVIFVTDDRKDDWWYRHEGKTIGPRPELVKEIWDEAGVLFHMYQPTQFLQIAKGRAATSEVITSAAVTEVEKVSERDASHRAELLNFREDLSNRMSATTRKLHRIGARIEDIEKDARRLQVERQHAADRGSHSADIVERLEREAAMIESQIRAMREDEDSLTDERRSWLNDLEHAFTRVQADLRVRQNEGWHQSDRPRELDEESRLQVMRRRRLREQQRLEAEAMDLADRIREIDTILGDDD